MLTKSKELINSVTVVTKKPVISSSDDLSISVRARSEGGTQRDNPTSIEILFDTPLIDGGPPNARHHPPAHARYMRDFGMRVGRMPLDRRSLNTY
jgi:hypothetical protein